ncbi:MULTISPECIES: MarR family winged helix-turn-helix transcriptional regulator [Enterobacteriaceae]|uniref:MarR family transcriptional regulator n=1 Tax=Kluyvera genomosp. 2 TaxID=2774054 RepID=A0A2T2XX21_9ENTR|nr:MULTISPECIES: MarR family winged helix-turn-helix transcriptional regulator [Enterobacteriaceae]HAT3920625.1 winged helix-turn-helix transcriptional regulator [Kluyvera ascorbata]PSR44768.1 MarR family transcriptional regulator [Kluyvera genomosp. 2]BBQ83539.1 MarR family transcriptional regulator [Klebsiella sp. WP3-W18-ESBL-02]BBR20562.1 MarR family transcriptional regulator [Klebsiella sp. WP3-S18-ESBL-05]BBR59234.1 MarR family transcriptional regulator [Klebsiella sp. WP4-W18-ESBL-05]
MSNLKKTAGEGATGAAFHREEFPFYWIVNVYARYTQTVELALKKVALDVSRFRVLMITHQYGQASISQIAEYALAKMPTVTKIVGRLRDDGLVVTASSPSDARVTMVMLTEAGQQKVAEAMPLVGKIFDKGFKGMSPGQVEKMNQSLAKVLDNLNEL